MDSSSDDDAGGPGWSLSHGASHLPASAECDLQHVLSDDSLVEAALDVVYESRDNDSWSSDEQEHLEGVRALRLARRTDAWGYPGDLLRCIEGEHTVESLNWSSLPPDEQDRRWIDEFRMKEVVFLELLELVTPHLQPSIPQNIVSQRMYTIKEKLLVTLNFLAHCHTLRQMATKWGMPDCSISELCLHPTVRVLRYIFLQQAGTKNVCWAKGEEAQLRVMQGFRAAYALPGCLGAIDGSLIPLKKPTKAQANQDADSYYLTKGELLPCSLLCAMLICSSLM
jgi:hypothetical protein